MAVPAACRAAMMLLMATAACGGSAPVPQPIPVDQYGSYRFLQRVEGADPPITVEGEFTIEADSIRVGLASGYCRPLQPSTVRSTVFHCGPVTLYFDREQPLLRSGFSVQGTAYVFQRVCRRYGTSPTGARICLEYGQDRIQVTRQFGGVIRPIPVH